MLGYRTKIIILLFWFRAGARPRRAPVRQCVDAPHARIHAQSARAAVRGPGALQFVLGEQGRRSSGPGPVGQDAPPSPLPRQLRPLGAQLRGQLFFLGFQTIKFLQSKIFQSRNKHQNRSGFARSYYLAPAVRCGEEVFSVFFSFSSSFYQKFKNVINYTCYLHSNEGTFVIY